MTDREDIDMLAAEFVLGTLDHEERSEVERRRTREADLAAAIHDWQRRLAALDAYAVETDPSPGAFDRIAARIGPHPEPAPVVTFDPDGAGNQAEILKLRDRIGTWRRLAVAATAVAAALAAVIVFDGVLSTDSKQQYVAVFNQDDTTPQFILSIDLATRELTIRPLAASPATDKSYELWIVSDQIELRSLGLLGSSTAPTRKRLQNFDPALLQTATFGISLEPKGGSPIGKPTGQALHGKLIPAGK